MAEEARRGRGCRRRRRLAGAAATDKQGGAVLGSVLVCEGDSRRTVSWQQSGGRGRSAMAALAMQETLGPRLVWRLAARLEGEGGLWAWAMWETLAAAAPGVRDRNLLCRLARSRCCPVRADALTDDACC